MIVYCLCQTELQSDKKKTKLHNQACKLEKLRSTVEGLEKRLHDLSKNLHIVGPVRGEDLLRKRPPAGRTSSPKAFRAQVENVSPSSIET